MFFGVSEPVEHFLHPPLGFEAADTAGGRRHLPLGNPCVAYVRGGGAVDRLRVV